MLPLRQPCSQRGAGGEGRSKVWRPNPAFRSAHAALLPDGIQPLSMGKQHSEERQGSCLGRIESSLPPLPSQPPPGMWSDAQTSLNAWTQRALASPWGKPVLQTLGTLVWVPLPAAGSWAGRSTWTSAPRLHRWLPGCKGTPSPGCLLPAPGRAQQTLLTPSDSTKSREPGRMGHGELRCPGGANPPLLGLEVQGHTPEKCDPGCPQRFSVCFIHCPAQTPQPLQPTQGHVQPCCSPGGASSGTPAGRPSTALAGREEEEGQVAVGGDAQEVPGRSPQSQQQQCWLLLMVWGK